MSTTIGALKKELNGFIDTLKDTRKNLKSEIQRIEKDAGGLLDEFGAGAKTFARNTLNELDGASFDQIAHLAQSVPQLTGQGLAYYRQSFIERRETALAKINRILKETVDVATFSAALAAAKSGYDDADEKRGGAENAADSAGRKLREWNNSPEHKLVEFDSSLREAGKPGIGPDSRDYYDTESLREAIIRYITRDSSYRQVRRVLVDYRQGFDGRDAFADICSFKVREQALGEAVSAAGQAKKAADDIYETAKSQLNILSGGKKDIMADEEILRAVQDKLAEYLSTPEFMKAAADQYGEDFPASLPLLAAKLKTLESLRADAEQKLKKLAEDISVAETSYDKMRNADSSRRISVDLDEIRTRNERYRQGYNDYTDAAGRSRRDTASWTQQTTVPGQSGSSSDIFWNILLWDTMFNHSHDHGQDSHQSRGPWLPDLPGTSGGSMDLSNISFGQPSAASSLNLDVSLDDIFREVANGQSGIDLSPTWEPPPAPSRSGSDDSWGSSSSSSSSDWGSSSSSMDSGGSMDL